MSEHYEIEYRLDAIDDAMCTLLSIGLSRDQIKSIEDSYRAGAKLCTGQGDTTNFPVSSKREGEVMLLAADLFHRAGALRATTEARQRGGAHTPSGVQ
jgi:hypothetical protein